MPPAADSNALDFPEFEGTISFENHTLTVVGSIQVDQRGAIRYTLSSIPSGPDSNWLLRVMYPSTRVLPRLQFRGTTSDGIQLSSQHLYISSGGRSSDSEGVQFRISGDLLSLEATYRELPLTSKGIRLIYFPSGMKCFRTPNIASSVGQIVLSGSHEIHDPDALSGQLQIEAPKEEMPFEEWRGACDKMANKIFDLVSLAEGRFFRASVRRIEDDEGLIKLFCDGPRESGPYQDGLLSHLHLQPVLELTLNKYTDDLCQRTGLPVAIEWFVHHPGYNELLLISTITALEHLVSVYIRENGKPPIIEQEVFDGLVKTTREHWKKELALPVKDDETTEEKAVREGKKAARERLVDKLGPLNDGSFRDQLTAMICHVGVSLEGLTPKQINDAVAARNLVVHNGLYRKKKDKDPALHEHISILREFVARLILELLGYRGQYWSIWRARYVAFPPAPEPAPAVAESKSTASGEPKEPA